MRRQVSGLVLSWVLSTLLMSLADGSGGNLSGDKDNIWKNIKDRFGGGCGRHCSGKTTTTAPPTTTTTTPPPLVCPECQGPVCEVAKELDVVFLVDTSSLDGDARLFYSGSADTSASQALWEYKNFIKYVIGELDISNGVRTAAFDLNESPKLLWSFSDDRDNICTAIDNLLPDGDGRYMDVSLSAALQLFKGQDGSRSARSLASSTFARSRREALLSLVIITYGLSNDGTATEDVAKMFHDINLPITMMSIGPADPDMASEAAAIVGSINQPPFFSPSFMELENFIEEFRRVLAGLPTGGGRYGGGPGLSLPGGFFVTDLAGQTLQRRLDDAFQVVVSMESDGFPTGVDYDPSTSFIFWTTYFPEELWRTELDGDGKEIPGTRRRLDSFANPLTSERVHIMRSTSQLVVSIWTEGIYVYNFDGSQKQFLIQDEILHCHAMVLDEPDNMIAFVDFFTENLYVAPLDVRDQPLPAPKIRKDVEDRSLRRYPSGLILDRGGIAVLPGEPTECCKINANIDVSLITITQKGGLNRTFIYKDFFLETTLLEPDPERFADTGDLEVVDGALFISDKSGVIYMYNLTADRPEFVLVNGTTGQFYWPYGIQNIINQF